MNKPYQVSMTRRAMPDQLMLLVGPPKPDRSKDRGQTRFDPNPPNCRLSMGLTTLSYKKNNIVTETARKAALVVYDRRAVSK